MNGELIMQYKQLIIIYILLYFFLFIAAYFHLNLATSLPDAKIPKYIPQNFLRAYLPDDFPEMIQRLAKVLRN